MLCALDFQNFLVLSFVSVSFRSSVLLFSQFGCIVVGSDNFLLRDFILVNLNKKSYMPNA